MSHAWLRSVLETEWKRIEAGKTCPFPVKSNASINLAPQSN
jgi:hypothetical protein